MGKSTSSIIESVKTGLEPIKYVVTNTDKIILVTHDSRFAERIAILISELEDPEKYFLTVKT